MVVDSGPRAGHLSAPVWQLDDVRAYSYSPRSCTRMNILASSAYHWNWGSVFNRNVAHLALIGLKYSLLVCGTFVSHWQHTRALGRRTATHP